MPAWRGWALVAVLGLVAAGLSYPGYRWYQGVRYKAAIGGAKAAIGAGRVEEAHELLEEAIRHAPGRGEAEYLMAAWELSQGREEEAKEALESVPAGSEFGDQAAMMLARLALNWDRQAEAEPYLRRALGAGGQVGITAREVLLNLYKMQGRIDEARKLVQEGWEIYPDRVGTLQQLWKLDTENAISLEEQRFVLEAAAQRAPEDDRVALGRATLALRSGRYEEAVRFLNYCKEKRPEDPSVWRVWLNYAIASQDAALAREAVGKLPEGYLTPEDLLSMRAWFAARRGDVESERAALTELVKLAPSRLTSLERLAGLTLQSGRKAEAAKLRARKGELDKLISGYAWRIYQPNPIADAERLAGHAETLGRLFEARGWWSLAAEAHRGKRGQAAVAAVARLDRELASRGSSETLAALLAEVDAEMAAAPGRKIVAGGGADLVMPRFVDNAASAGLNFIYDSGKSEERQVPETMGTGLALLDYDGDGWLDVYATQGGPFPPDPTLSTAGDRLFRNLGNGRFEDATESAGVANEPYGYGHGAAVGDYDNDGDADLFVTRFRSYSLFQNQGDGTFRDATAEVGLGGDQGWPTSAAFADLDQDGDLDLYVCQYLQWDPANPMICHDPDFKANRLCNPGLSPSLPDRLYRNDGGRFVDVTKEAGIVDENGRGMGVVANDFDGDGLVDIYVANDQTANFLFRNLGGMKFEEVGHLSGVASSGSGGYQASMGTDCGDVDGDGLPDLVATNFYNEGTTLYQNLGQGIFTDRSESFGVTVATRFMLGFGVVFLDANNDGRLDLAQANGHVDDFRPESPYMMPPQMMVGTAQERFLNAGAEAGAVWGQEHLGRAIGVGDLDNDGRLDLVMICIDTPLVYFQNQTAGGHWLTVKLEGATSNRDGVGARVVVKAGEQRVTKWRIGGGSYQTASDGRLHFGLGDAVEVESVEVSWPSGLVERFEGAKRDSCCLLREGDGQAKLLWEGRRPEGAQSAGAGGVEESR